MNSLKSALIAVPLMVMTALTGVAKADNSYSDNRHYDRSTSSYTDRSSNDNRYYDRSTNTYDNSYHDNSVHAGRDASVGNTTTNNTTINNNKFGVQSVKQSSK